MGADHEFVLASEIMLDMLGCRCYGRLVALHDGYIVPVFSGGASDSGGVSCPSARQSSRPFPQF